MRKYLPYLFLFVIIAFHAVNNYMIISLDESPMLWDPLSNFAKSVNMYNLLIGQDSLTSSNFLNGNYGFRGIYPPLMYFNTVVFYFIFGIGYKIAIFSNITFLVIFLFFYYEILKFFSDDLIAVLITSVVSFFPGIYRFLRIYNPDFALMSVTVMSIYFLFKSECFSNKKYSLFCGISLGLGMLCKQSFLFVLPPVCLISLFKIKKRDFSNLGGSVFLAAVICSPWYFLNLQNGAGVPIWALVKTIDGYKFLDYFGIYLLDLYSYSLEKMMFIIVLFSFICTLFIKYRYKLELFIWFFVPLILFSFFLTESAVKYSLPVIPACGIFIAVVLNKLERFKQGSVLFLIVLLFQSTNTYLNSSYPEGEHYFLCDDLEWDEKVVFCGMKNAKTYKLDFLDLDETISRYFGNKKDLKVLTLFDTIDSECIRFEFLTKKKGIFVNSFLKDIENLHYNNINDLLSNYDVILIKPQDSCFLAHPSQYYAKSFIIKAKEELNTFRQNSSPFEYLKTIVLRFGEKEFEYLVYIAKQNIL